MSVLASVMAARTEPSIYLWHSGFDVEQVRHTVEHAEWEFAHVDGWKAERKAEFLEAVGEALGFPEHYGRNFDALADCLQDVRAGDHDHAGTLLLWDGWGTLARHDERAFRVALSVLGGRFNADRGGRFVVLLRGEGPRPDGVRSLD